MKKTKLALAVAASTLASAPALATNGDELIGLGAQSRALGGTGVAAFYGAENQLINPAMLGKAEGSEFVIGGTLFMPDVEAETNIAAMPGDVVSESSDADQNVIPEVSMATRINDNWTFGLGMYGTAGMGVDYSDNGDYTDGMGMFNASSALQLMKFVPTFAFNQNNFGFGFSPVIQYGTLDLNYQQYNDGGTPMDPSDDSAPTVGSGVSDDLATGFDLGAYFDINQNLTVALAYQSAIEMEYEDQITTAADGFGIGPNGMGTITSDKLEQPAQFKVGIAYTMNNWLLTADAKQIGWGDAEGYEDFGWDDQNVYGVGAKYSGNGYWVGVGYNYGEDPIEVLPDVSGDAMATYSNQAINTFNNHFFPAVVESHYTIGGGYQLSKTMTLEGSIVYADEVTKEVDTSAITSMMMGAAMESSHEVTHSQLGYTISLRMNF